MLTVVHEKKLAHITRRCVYYLLPWKRYDSIPLNKLWEMLGTTNINIGLTKAVRKCHDKTTSEVKVGDTVTKGFRVTDIVKQI